MCGKFSSFTTPSLRCRYSVLNLLCLPFLALSFAYLILRRLVCFSGSLGSSVSIQRCYMGIVPHADDFLICCGEKVVSLSIPSPSCPGPPGPRGLKMPSTFHFHPLGSQAARLLVYSVERSHLDCLSSRQALSFPWSTLNATENII